MLLSWFPFTAPSVTIISGRWTVTWPSLVGTTLKEKTWSPPCTCTAVSASEKFATTPFVTEMSSAVNPKIGSENWATTGNWSCRTCLMLSCRIAGSRMLLVSATVGRVASKMAWKTALALFRFPARSSTRSAGSVTFTWPSWSGTMRAVNLLRAVMSDPRTSSARS